MHLLALIGPLMTMTDFLPSLPFLKADTHKGFCSRSMLQAHFARVSTHEGAFSSLLNLPQELAPKYLTG